MCPENGFKQHEYKFQEKLTTKKIEYDLKRNYGRGAIFISIATVILSALFIIPIIVVANDTPVKNEGASKYLLIAILVLLSLVLLLLWALSTYAVYMRLFGYKKFKIGIDTFTGFEKRRWWGIYSWDKENNKFGDDKDIQYFQFARFGRFRVGERVWYYTWSENYKTYSHELEDSFRIGERVYVVLIGKRIQYVYNDKMFDLSETLFKERLIDDVELLKREKQLEREQSEQ